MPVPDADTTVSHACRRPTDRPAQSPQTVNAPRRNRPAVAHGMAFIAATLLACTVACNSPTAGGGNGSGPTTGSGDVDDEQSGGGGGSDNGDENGAGGNSGGDGALELSNAIVRQLAEGDRWEFEERQLNTRGGQTVETVGTQTYEVLEGVFDDAGGNAVRALSATYDAVIEGAGQSVRTLYLYFSQDTDGTVSQHGQRNEYVNPPEERFVASPISGKYFTFASPLEVGATQSWDVLYDDGSRLSGESRVLAIEQRRVPAGAFVTARIAITQSESSPTGVSTLTATLWYVPALGREVLAEYESRTGEGESLSVTTGTRELLETNIVLDEPADDESGDPDMTGEGDQGVKDDGTVDGEDNSDGDAVGGDDDTDSNDMGGDETPGDDMTDDGETGEDQGGDDGEAPPDDPPADDPADENAIDLFEIPEDAEFITTESGLEYYHLEEGTGDQPNTDSVVRVAYIGFKSDGTVFDANEDAVFDLTNLIAGFTEGITLMREGGSTRLVIPPDLGYGAGGNPSAGIGGEDVILFDVVLIEIDVL